MPSVQAFTPFVRVVTDAARHFATFGLAPAAALEPIAIGIKLPMPITGMMATRESHHPLGRIRWCFSCKALHADLAVETHTVDIPAVMDLPVRSMAKVEHPLGCGLKSNQD